jgi:hypothetical protein
MQIFSPFFFGILAACGTLFLELLLFAFGGKDQSTSFLSSSDANVIIASGGLLFLFYSAIIEEALKLSLLHKIIPLHQGIFQETLFLFCFGIGFSSVEISLLLLTNTTQITQSIVLSLTGILTLHLATITLLGRSLFKQLSKLWLIIAFCSAVLIHFTYNFFLF